MTVRRFNLLWKFAAAAFICLAVAVFVARAATPAVNSTTSERPAVLTGGNPSPSPSASNESLGVRCGWIVTEPGMRYGVPGDPHVGPCSGHTNGGMTQGAYVPFR